MRVSAGYWALLFFVGILPLAGGCSFKFDPVGTLSGDRRMWTGGPASSGRRGHVKARSAARGAQSVVVGRGETLHSIAEAHGVTAGYLMRVNELEGTDIYPGQRLLVR